MLYFPHFVAKVDSMRSGLPSGTMPALVTTAIVARARSRTGGGGGPRSAAGTGHAVPPGVEGWPDDDQRGLVAFDQRQQLLRGRLGLLVEVVVAAVDRRDDLRPVAQRLGQRAARPDRAGHGARRLVRAVLRADAGE